MRLLGDSMRKTSEAEAEAEAEAGGRGGGNMTGQVRAEPSHQPQRAETQVPPRWT